MKLYYSSGACSLASHIVLAETGAKFEAVKISLRDGEQRTPEYLKMNPKGKVPALLLDDGQVLTENPCIMSWLADAHPSANLLAPVGDLARARAQEWLAWCASGVQPSFGPLWGAARWVDGAEAQKSLTEKARAGAQGQLDAFDRGLTGKSFVLGNQFSIADAYTIVFFNWARVHKLKAGPAHRASVEKLLARPAVARVLATEGVRPEL